LSEAATAQEASSSEAPRCIGCGKPVTTGKTYLILTGKTNDGEFRETGTYGHIHQPCFVRAVESPRSVLDEIQRIAKSAPKGRLRKVK
jgi:hypothetical protein